MKSVFFPVALLASVFGSFAQSLENNSATIQANAMQRLRIADRYLSFHDPHKALRIFRNIFEDEQVNYALRRIAELKHNAAMDRSLHYTFSASVNPFTPNRKYKTDTLYLKVGSSLVPFTVSRDAAGYNILSFSQKLFIYPSLNKEHVRFDNFTFAHSFKRDSVGGEENTIGIGLKPHFPSDHLNLFYNIDWKNDHLNNKSLTHTVKAKWVARSFDLGVSLATTDVNFDLNAPINATRDLTLTTRFSSQYNDYVFDAQHEHKTFAVPGNDCGLTTIGVSKYVSAIGSSIRLQYQSRTDEQPKFPANVARTDTTYSILLAKQVGVSKMRPTFNIKASQNVSNVGIYSFDEVAFYITFGL